MKQIVTSLALVLSAATMNAQTTATNFTAKDCNGTNHTLFDELNAGKVVVLAWVMPCGSCIGPAKTAYNVVQNFAATNPGKVLFYMSDDFGNSTCLNLTNWIANEGIGDASKMTLFDNAGNTIDENNFGGTGMPHVVVMGGPNHEIFFNKRNNNAKDSLGITSAINSAIVATSVADLNNEIAFSVAPNPAKGHVVITYDKAISRITITSVTGQVVKEQNFAAGSINPSLDIAGLANGTYMLRVTDADNKTGVQKIVKQ